MLNLTQVQKLNCEPLSAFHNLHHKGSKSFDIQSCVSTSKEKSRSNRILQFRTRFGSDCISKKLNRIRYGYSICIDHCSKMLNQSFFGYKPDWMKYLDRSTGLRSDRITQWKFWTGLRLPKSPICSTLLTRDVKRSATAFCAMRFWKILPRTSRTAWFLNMLSCDSAAYRVDGYLMMNLCKTKRLFGSYCVR